MRQILEVENTDIDTSWNHEKMKSKEETKRAIAHQNI